MQVRVCPLGALSGFQTSRKPLNILWLIGEDMGPQIGCYGYPQMRTPHIDKLASEGVRFTNAFTTAPVCSPSRSAWNTGMYQTAIGAHHHRSHRRDGYRLPDGVKLVSHRLREAGYFTANVLEGLPGFKGMGKTDFNFQAEEPFQGSHWSQCLKQQTLLCANQFSGNSQGARVSCCSQAALSRRPRQGRSSALLSRPPSHSR